MADEKIKFDEVKCSVELFNKVIGVLQKIPYNQVATLMDEIKVGFFAIPLAPEIHMDPAKPGADTGVVNGEQLDRGMSDTGE